MKVLPIVFTCDNNYFKYTAIVIKSILVNRDDNTIYEFNILSEDISTINKDLGLELVSNYKNATIKYITLENVDKDRFFLNSYMNISTYYRFFIPKIFTDYERVLYLDSDLIVDNDISFYSTIDFENKIAITSPSPYVQNLLIEESHPNFTMSYFNNHLRMTDIKQYFNAGVILLNLKKIRDEQIDQKLFDSIDDIKKPIFQDQDLFNSVFYNNGGVKMISNHFNNSKTYNVTILRLFFNVLRVSLFNKKRNDWFSIYHYVGKVKPWQEYKIDTNLFLYYAYKTAFISSIFDSNPNLKISKINKLKLWVISKF